MKQVKKILACFLAVAVMVAMIPLTNARAENAFSEPNIELGKWYYTDTVYINSDKEIKYSIKCDMMMLTSFHAGLSYDPNLVEIIQLEEKTTELTDLFGSNNMPLTITNDTANHRIDISGKADDEGAYGSEEIVIVTFKLKKTGKANFILYEDSKGSFEHLDDNILGASVNIQCCDNPQMSDPVITPATPQSEGKITSTCASCGYVDEETIPQIDAMTLAEGDYTYTGKEITPEVTVKDKAGNVIAPENYTIAYKDNTNAGTATAVVTFKGERYSGTLEKTFEIQPCEHPNLTATVIAPSTPEAAGTEKFACNDCDYVREEVIPQIDAMTLAEGDYTYTGKEITPEVTVKDKAGNVIGAENYTVAYKDNTNAGTATAVVTFKGERYSGTLEKTFEIQPCKHLKMSDPVIVPSTPQKYGLVTSKCEHCDYVQGELIPQIDAMTFSANSYTYTGKANTPVVTVKDQAGNVIAPENYTVAYKNNINAGTATAVVTFKGEFYSGTLEKTFAIKAKALPSNVKLSTSAYTYNGKAKTPSVTVKDGSKVLKKNVDYTVSYASGRKAVGTYKVTVKGKGNYAGSKALSFTIQPKGTSISKLTAKSKGFSVKWKKQASQTTGYQIRYAKKSNMSAAKTVTVKKNTATSTTISKQSAKKKYYVQIRTYKKSGSKTYYSAWSKTKSVTTKK